MKQIANEVNIKKLELKFTPLEFETDVILKKLKDNGMLKFTPLEFETFGQAF